MLTLLIEAEYDQIVSFIQEELSPIYTFQFALHFSQATRLLVHSQNIRTNHATDKQVNACFIFLIYFPA
jgi:hypothetical protein